MNEDKQELYTLDDLREDFTELLAIYFINEERGLSIE